MHSKFLPTVVLALCVARGVMSAPLDTYSVEDPKSDKHEETTNMEKIASATRLAHKNVLKMELVLKEPNRPENAEMIRAAFGVTTPDDLQKIKTTVGQLKTGVVPVKLAPSANSRDFAFTAYNEKTEPTHVQFGNTFYGPRTSNNARAATVVHEATHYISNTGDYIKDGTILPGNDRIKTRYLGYGNGRDPKSTPAELDQDATWTRMRDGFTMKDIKGTIVEGTKDLYGNAESFGQFSGMCGAAVSDHEVGLRRRTLEERDWDTAAFFLVKRQMCSFKAKPKAKTAPTTDPKLSSSAKTKVSAVSKFLGAQKAAEAKKTGATATDRSLSRSANLSPNAKSKIRAVSKLNIAAKKANAKKLSTSATKQRLSTSTKVSSKAKPALRTKSSLSKSKSAKSTLLKGSKKTLPALSKSQIKGRVASAKFGAAHSKTAKMSKAVKTSKSATAPRVKAKGAASKKLKSFPVSKKNSPLSSKRPTSASKKNLAKPSVKSAKAPQHPSSLKRTSPANKVFKTQTNKRVVPKAKMNSVTAKRPSAKKQANIGRPAENRGGSTPAVEKTSQAVSKKTQPPPPPLVKAKVLAKPGRA